jgi:hypothetical protein
MVFLREHHLRLPATDEFALNQRPWHSQTGGTAGDLAWLFIAVDFAYTQNDMTASRPAFILPDRQVLLHFCNALGFDRPARQPRGFTFAARTRTL